MFITKFYDTILYLKNVIKRNNISKIIFFVFCLPLLVSLYYKSKILSFYFIVCSLYFSYKIKQKEDEKQNNLDDNNDLIDENNYFLYIFLILIIFTAFEQPSYGFLLTAFLPIIKPIYDDCKKNKEFMTKKEKYDIIGMYKTIDEQNRIKTIMEKKNNKKIDEHYREKIQSVKNKTFEDHFFNACSGNIAKINNCTFINTSFFRCIFGKVDIDDKSSFKNSCRISMCWFGYFRKGETETESFWEANIENALIDHTSFVKVDMSKTSFKKSYFKKSIFIDCKMPKCELDIDNIKNVIFINTDLSQVNFITQNIKYNNIKCYNCIVSNENKSKIEIFTSIDKLLNSIDDKWANAYIPKIQKYSKGNKAK